MKPVDVPGKSLVYDEAARKLVIGMYLRMGELVRRVGILDGNYDVVRES